MKKTFDKDKHLSNRQIAKANKQKIKKELVKLHGDPIQIQLELDNWEPPVVNPDSEEPIFNPNKFDIDLGD